MVLSSTLCQACPLEGKVRCSGCHKIGVLTRYCSRKCQEILWVTHKDHCGKNNGLFVHPDATPVEVMACIRGVLGREATADPDASFVEELSSNFSNKIAELFYGLPRIPTKDLYAEKTTVFCQYWVDLYFEANQKLNQELRSCNNFGVRNLATFLAVPRLDGSRYTNMPNLKGAIIEEHPNKWITTCSDYNFLNINLYTVLAHMRANMSQYPRGHFAEPATTHFIRITDEADRLEKEGHLDFFDKSQLGFQKRYIP